MKIAQSHLGSASETPFMRVLLSMSGAPQCRTVQHRGMAGLLGMAGLHQMVGLLQRSLLEASLRRLRIWRLQRRRCLSSSQHSLFAAACVLTQQS